MRVLQYTDSPGDCTHPHVHPDSVMVTLKSFRRRLTLGDQQREVELASGLATWLPAQRHSGENIGDTETHTIFVELKEPAPASTARDPVGSSEHPGASPQDIGPVTG